MRQSREPLHGMIENVSELSEVHNPGAEKSYTGYNSAEAH